MCQTSILFLVLLCDTANNIPHQCPWEQLLGVDVHPYRSNQKLATITAGSVFAQLHLQVAVSTVCTVIMNNVQKVQEVTCIVDYEVRQTEPKYSASRLKTFHKLMDKHIIQSQTYAP